MSKLCTTANGHMTSICAQIEITNLSLKNSTNLSLKNSRVQMSLMHTSQFEITNLSLKNSRVRMSIGDRRFTNISVKN